MDARPRKKATSEAASDRKERHLCFAYRGPAIDTSKLEALHICHARGIIEDDGLRYVQMTLSRPNARRAANLKNVVAEYNKVVGAPLRVAVEPNAEAVFPLTNEIEIKIKTGRGGWEWPAAQEVTEAKPKPAARRLALVALVESLGLDPRAVNMRGAEEEVKFQYEKEKGKQPGFMGMYDEADQAFLVSVLQRYFQDELAITIAPPRPLPAHVRASLDGWMGDCLPDVMEQQVMPLEPARIVESGTKNRKKIEFRSSKPPQPIVLAYLHKMATEWSGRVVLSASDVKFALNKNQANGVYRTTDACGFMRPFVHDGCVDMYCVMSRDGRPAYEFHVDVERLRAFLLRWE